MSLLTAEQIPTVGLEFMNHDHAEALKQINRLDQLILQTAAGDKAAEECISAVLTEISEHSTQHFAREEAEMLRVDFPAYGCHKAEHERVLAELARVLQQWQQNSDAEALQNYLHNTLCHWLINHVSTMDSVTAMFVARYNQSVA
ncbi:bacteriohemerythrin [Amphritea sp.]|uniref:bacteriohemerythrin n=1 Tax=Amphritea sp. TaxID=1872502 RepID=UPI003D0DD0BC